MALFDEEKLSREVNKTTRMVEEGGGGLWQTNLIKMFD